MHADHCNFWFILQVKQFIFSVYKSESIYGLQQETLDSLILDFLPPLSHVFIKPEDDGMVDNKQDVSIYLFQEIMKVLGHNAGFHIPEVN